MRRIRRRGRGRFPMTSLIVADDPEALFEHGDLWCPHAAIHTERVNEDDRFARSAHLIEDASRRRTCCGLSCRNDRTQADERAQGELEQRSFDVCHALSLSCSVFGAIYPSARRT